MLLAPRIGSFVNAASGILLLWALAGPAKAQEGGVKLNLGKAEAAQFIADGDRLADQHDYEGALKKYTRAYLGVVSRIRGQRFTENVIPSIFDREQLGQEMLRMMNDEFTPEELELMDASYKALGLVPADVDVQAVFTKLLTEEVAGFYDPDNKRMVMIVEEGSGEDPGWFARLLGARPAFDKDEQKMTLAHELTHALQDQLYDLNAMEERIEKDDDMLLAFSALVEGDATLLMFAEGGGQEVDIKQMDAEAMRTTFNFMSFLVPFSGGETYRNAPPIFRDSLIFPYIQGMLFVLSQAPEDGWEAIHRCYQSPPVSTEQILHPSKYRAGDQYDAPQQVTLPEFSEVLDDQWQLLGGNCLGELQMGIMLKSVMGGRVAARGWDGDYYAVFKNEQGKLALALASIWDSEQDAKQFADAYRRYRAANSPADTSPQQEASGTSELDAISQETPQSLQTIQQGEEQLFAEGACRSIQWDGEKVFIVEGFDEATTNQLAEQIKRSQFSEKRFPVTRSAN